MVANLQYSWILQFEGCAFSFMSKYAFLSFQPFKVGCAVFFLNRLRTACEDELAVMRHVLKHAAQFRAEIVERSRSAMFLWVIAYCRAVVWVEICPFG